MKKRERKIAINTKMTKYFQGKYTEEKAKMPNRCLSILIDDESQ